MRRWLGWMATGALIVASASDQVSSGLVPKEASEEIRSVERVSGPSWLVAAVLALATPEGSVAEETASEETAVVRDEPALSRLPSPSASPPRMPAVYLPARRIPDRDVTLQYGLGSARPWQDREICLVHRSTLEGIPEDPFHLPARIVEDFETTLTGLTPAAAGVLYEGRGDALGVVEGSRGGVSQKCLRIAGTPQTGSRLHPYLYYRPAHEDGESVCRLDLFVESGGGIRLEGRQERGGVLLGPVLEVHDGRVFVQGRAILDLPEEAWVAVEIRARLGRLADGTWSITVSPTGGLTRSISGLAADSADWQRLDVLALFAVPTRGGGALVDNVEIRNARDVRVPTS